VRDGRLVVSFTDDGRGIDWDAIRRSAGELGLPADSERDLVAALLSPGVTTRGQASALSGRGFGMSAVARRVEELEGTVHVESRKGAGTCWRFSFALSSVARAS
jgi:chemotaxis protein histidine kinase CheA